MSSAKNYQNGITPPSMMAARALDKKYLKTTSPEPLVQIQIISQIYSSYFHPPILLKRLCCAEQDGHQSYRKEIYVNGIFSETTGP